MKYLLADESGIGGKTKQAYVAFVILIALLASGCASQQTKTEPSRNEGKWSTAALPEKAVSNDASVEVSNTAVVQGEIVGRPAAGSKFAKLKLGMTLTQVEQLIGPAARRHPFNKHAIPHKGARYSYRREGVLTFSDADEPLLIRILVNRVE